MAGNVGVSLDVLQSTRGVIREQNSMMASKLSNISSSVSTLRGSWDSPAAQQLEGIASTMSERFEELKKTVESFASFLDQVITNYERGEVINQEILDQILKGYQ